MKKTALIALFAVLTTASMAKSKSIDKNSIQTLGFECAQDYIDVIPMIGRGEDFPNFLAKDIETELKRQSKTSKLVSITCEGEPELKVAYALVEENEQQQQVVSTLSFTIPVEVVVKNGKSVTSLMVDQNYYVENLDKPNQQKTTQNFIVKN